MLLGHAVRKVDRQRHEHIGLVAGVAEHHALVACALRVELVLLGLTRSDLFRGRDALRDVGRLLIEGDHDAAGVAVVPERLVVVADLVDRAPNGAGDVDVGLGGDFASDDGKTGGDERFARHPAHRILRQHLVEDGVGNLVGHLVGMALRNTLGGEGPTGHGCSWFIAGRVGPLRCLARAVRHRACRSVGHRSGIRRRAG